MGINTEYKSIKTKKRKRGKVEPYRSENLTYGEIIYELIKRNSDYKELPDTLDNNYINYLMKDNKKIKEFSKISDINYVKDNNCFIKNEYFNKCDEYYDTNEYLNEDYINRDCGECNLIFEDDNLRCKEMYEDNIERYFDESEINDNEYNLNIDKSSISTNKNYNYENYVDNDNNKFYEKVNIDIKLAKDNERYAYIRKDNGNTLTLELLNREIVNCDVK
jgi:hypothetical protein